MMMIDAFAGGARESHTSSIFGDKKIFLEVTQFREAQLLEQDLKSLGAVS